MVNADAQRAAIYVRVSSRAQAAEDKTSLERQEANCRKRAAEDDLTVVEECVVKDAYSASDPYSRTKLVWLHTQAEHGTFHYVIMDLVDRTTRAGPLDFFDICKRFLDCDVTPLWATDRHIDLTTVEGQRRAMEEAYYAWRDKQTIIRRLTGGKEGRIAEGKPLGAYLPYGTVWADKERTRMRSDGDASENVRRIFAYLAGGGTASSLIDELNAQHVPTPSQVKGRKNAPTVWQPGTIHEIVYDEIYIGIRVHHRFEITPRPYQERKANGFKSPRKIRRRKPDDPALVRLHDVIEPLIDEATFYTAQEHLQANVFFSKRNGKKFDAESVLLSGGHVRCAVCGHGLIPDRRGGPTWHYNCTRSSRLPDGSRCPGVSVSCREVDDFVWQQACWLIRDPERRRKLIEHTDIT